MFCLHKTGLVRCKYDIQLRQCDSDIKSPLCWKPLVLTLLRYIYRILTDWHFTLNWISLYQMSGSKHAAEMQQS